VATSLSRDRLTAPRNMSFEGDCIPGDVLSPYSVNHPNVVPPDFLPNGSVNRIKIQWNRGWENCPSFCPVLQVTDWESHTMCHETECAHDGRKSEVSIMTLFDGEQAIKAILLDEQVQRYSRLMHTNCYVRLDTFRATALNGRRAIAVKKLTIVLNVPGLPRG